MMAGSAEDSRDSLEDCTCPICMSIMIYPVTMPCHHELCMPCFKHNVEESSLLCPLCRLRISSWTRHASRTKTLVNESRWKQIRELFPERVQRRLDGKDEDTNEETFHHPPVHLAEPGEIRKEYEEELHKLRLQHLAERQKEAEESLQLISRLAKEEEDAYHQRQLQLEKTTQLDEVLAQELSEIINEADADSPALRERLTGSASSASTASNRSNNSSLATFFKTKTSRGKDPYPYTCLTPTDNDKDKTDGRHSKSSDTNLHKYSISAKKASEFEYLDHTYCPTPSKNKPSALGRPPSVDAAVGRSSSPNAATGRRSSSDATILPSNKDGENERSESTASSDSITNELCHFKPITACPRTPPRKLASGVFVDPPIVRTTPRNLSRNDFGSPLDQPSPGLNPGSPFMQRRLLELAEERKQLVKERSKSTSTLTASEMEVTGHPFLSHHSSVDEFMDGEDSLTRRPLHKHLDTNSDTVPSHELKRELLIPLEPIIEDADIMDIPSPIFHHMKMESEDRKHFSDGKENVIHPSSSGMVIHNSKAPVHKSMLKTVNKSKLSKDKHKTVHPSLTSPQRSIKDWLKLNDKYSDGMSPNSSDSPSSGVKFSHTGDISPISRSSQSDSEMDINTDRTVQRKNLPPVKQIHSFIDLDQFSDNSDFESHVSTKQVSGLAKDEWNSATNQLCSVVLESKDSLVDHAYHKNITTTGKESPSGIVSNICDDPVNSKSSLHKSDSSYKSLPKSQSSHETKKELQNGKIILEDFHTVKSQTIVISDKRRPIKKKRNSCCIWFDNDFERDNVFGDSEESPNKCSSPKKTRLAKPSATLKKKRDQSNIDKSLIRHDTTLDCQKSNKDRRNSSVKRKSSSHTATSKKKMGVPPKNKYVDTKNSGCLKEDVLLTGDTNTNSNATVSRKNRRINSVVKNVDSECQTPKKRMKRSRGLPCLHSGNKNQQKNTRSASLHESTTHTRRLRKSPQKRLTLIWSDGSEEEDDKKMEKRKYKDSEPTFKAITSPCSENPDPRITRKATSKCLHFQSGIEDPHVKNNDTFVKPSSSKGRRGSKSRQKSVGSAVCKDIHCSVGAGSDDAISESPEDHDRLVAMKLQKQFDLELKLNLAVGRFKGTDQQYHFRRKPKYS